MRDTDYTSYYVTGREMLPAGFTFLEHLDEACSGGVSIVQLREKTASTREFLEIARGAKKICDKHSIPLLINDRVDIALAVGCGLHVGQKDMPVRIARSLLGPNAIIGVSVSTATELEEVRSLDAGLVDYIGIGPVHATQSKKDHNPILGVRGTRDLLAVLSDSPIKVVAIGGLNEFTITNLWRQTRSLHPAGRGLDGVAYVSAVAASSQPREAANRLTSLIRQPSIPRLRILNKSHNFVQSACELLAQLRSTPPLVVQHVTNQVVMNDCANLTLALTRSPIMSGNPEEADDLGRIIGALVLNMGTLNDRQIEGAHLCGKAANRNNKPVLLDPVGVGATQYRKQTIADLMDGTHMSIVKGNAGEIGALSGLTEVKSRGVDSEGPGFRDPASVVKSLARREKMVVAMTGEIDYVSDGTLTIAIENGHALQGDITGSGCMAGTAIACFASVAGTERAFEAAVAGLLAYNVAAELAAAKSSVQGPNTFRSALIDACYHLKPEQILERARLRAV